MWIMFVFTFFIMFGTINVQIDSFSNQWNTCPKTQNCSKEPIVHHTDKIALELEKEDYLKQITYIKSQYEKCVKKIDICESIGADNAAANMEKKNIIDGLNKQLKQYEEKIKNLQR
jgi:hypothetical protein